MKKLIGCFLIFANSALASDFSQPQQPTPQQIKHQQLLNYHLNFNRLDYNLKPDSKCAAETRAVVKQKESNSDVHIFLNANFYVMFHDNRYPAAKELVDAFELENEGVKISYTSTTPINTALLLNSLVGKPTVGEYKEMTNMGFEIKLEDYFQPDVVMLPTSISVSIPTIEPMGVYSNVHGMVMITRKNDDRFNSLVSAADNKDVKFVVPGHNLQHPLWRIASVLIGYDQFKDILRERAGVSSVKSHRFIPLRIAEKCEDVGFQYTQSVIELERSYPGVFRFTSLEVDSDAFKPEESTVSIVKGSSHHKNAELFAKFMLSERAQTILKKYSMAITQQQ